MIKAVISEWERGGRYVTAGLHKLFFRDSGGENKPVMVILHGYPSNTYDYHKVLPLLAPHFRVIMHDHPGFGLSAKPLDYSYSLIEQADAALALWESLDLKEVHVVAHDYGTSICTEICARRQQGQLGSLKILSVTLYNGSIHIELAKLRFLQILLRHPFRGPWVAKLSHEFIFVRQMAALWSDRSKVDTVELQVLYRMDFDKAGRAVLPQVSQYLHERYHFWHRWIGALKMLNIPTHILWAQDDPVAVKAIGEQLYAEIPGATISRLAHLGHYPMLEDPERWVTALVDFIHRSKNVQ